MPSSFTDEDRNMLAGLNSKVETWIKAHEEQAAEWKEFHHREHDAIESKLRLRTEMISEIGDGLIKVDKKVSRIFTFGSAIITLLTLAVILSKLGVI
jgi:hypothetical protein